MTPLFSKEMDSSTIELNLGMHSARDRTHLPKINTNGKVMIAQADKNFDTGFNGLKKRTFQSILNREESVKFGRMQTNQIIDESLPGRHGFLA